MYISVCSMDLISDLDQKVWVEGNPKESKGMSKKENHIDS